MKYVRKCASESCYFTTFSFKFLHLSDEKLRFGLKYDFAEWIETIWKNFCFSICSRILLLESVGKFFFTFLIFRASLQKVLKL